MSRAICFGLLAISLALVGCAIQPTAANGQPHDIAADFRRFVAVWENGDLQRLNDNVDLSYRGHLSTGERNREGLRARIEKFHVLYSNVHFTVLDQVVSGDRVASRLEATCTESASGKTIHMYGMNISIIRYGKLFEEWAVWEVIPSGRS